MCRLITEEREYLDKGPCEVAKAPGPFLQAPATHRKTEDDDVHSQWRPVPYLPEPEEDGEGGPPGSSDL